MVHSSSHVGPVKKIKTMNILAIDYGKKRLGLAWAQSGIDVILPFGIVDASVALKEIPHIVKTEKIDTVVVGLPIGLDGNENDNTVRVREFASQLKKITAVAIDFCDERYSSHAADRFGADGASRDEKAAMIILQGYLEKKK